MMELITLKYRLETQKETLSITGLIRVRFWCRLSLLMLNDQHRCSFLLQRGIGCLVQALQKLSPRCVQACASLENRLYGLLLLPPPVPKLTQKTHNVWRITKHAYTHTHTGRVQLMCLLYQAFLVWCKMSLERATVKRNGEEIRRTEVMFVLGVVVDVLCAVLYLPCHT